MTRIRLFLDKLGCPIKFEDDESTCVAVGAGVIRLETKKRYHKSSASGAALAHLRSCGLFEDYLILLSEVAHKVTRLDAALDISTDTPPFLRKLERRYPDDRVNLGRKSVKITRMYSARASDGKQTGSWYCGRRTSARVTARVYDKQEEALAKRGETLPPTTRIELTFSKDFQPTLRDAAMPASLFYQYASPAIVPKPASVAPWQAQDGFPWESRSVDVSIDFEMLQRRIELSPELARLAVLAASLGEEGRQLLVSKFAEAIIPTGKRDKLKGAC